MDEAIINLFESYTQYLEYRVSRYHSLFPSYRIEILKRFIPKGRTMYPIEYESVLEDKFYYSIIKAIWSERQGILYFLKMYNEENKILLEQIKQELN